MTHVRESYRMRIVVTLLFACITSSATSTGATEEVCKDFNRLIAQTGVGGILVYRLETSAQADGEEQYFNLDIDGDDISDVVKGGCSPSMQPADPCNLLVKFSSGKEIFFTFEPNERFYLVRRRSRFYAVATDIASRKKDGSRNVLEINSNGITRVCLGL